MTAVPKPRDLFAQSRPARRSRPRPAADPAQAEAGQELGEILVQLGRLDAAGLQRIVAARTERNSSFGAAATRLGLVKPDDINAAVAIRRGFLAPAPQALALPKDLVLLRRPDSRQAEQFRDLRTRLLTTQAEKLSLLSVVGAGARARADYVALNLAASLAQLKKRVLLVDAELRAPRLSKLFATGDARGACDVLDGAVDLPDAVVQTPVVNLFLLTAGAARAAAQELLAGAGLRRLLDEARAAHDAVIVLTPPLGAAADGQILLAETRSALVVVRKDHARADDVRRLQSALRQVGAETLGAVLTR